MLALLYDIHGNLPALEAVLGDADQAGASSYLLGGDYALFGPWPAETVTRLRELPDAQWLRGNGERWTASPADAPDNETVQGAISACHDALGEPDVATLAALPEMVEIGETLACHASPVSDVRSFFPDPAPDEDELLAGIEAPRLIFGHTHLPFIRMTSDGIELVNPGSVGMPFDGDPRAAYALVRPDGRVEHRRVGYNHIETADAVRERFGGDWTRIIGARFEQARFDVGA
jgi:predicted phosphodiesterase